MPCCYSTSALYRRPGLSRLLSDLGVRLEQQVVVDPLSHYQSDAEMVAVTGYDPHPITRTLSLTFFPGIRPLTLTEPASGVEVTPILQSSRDSYARPVPPADARTIEGSVRPLRPRSRRCGRACWVSLPRGRWRRARRRCELW